MRIKALTLEIVTQAFAAARFLASYFQFNPGLYPTPMIGPMVQPARYAVSIKGDNADVGHAAKRSSVQGGWP